MNRLRAHRLGAWVALLAMVLGALAPAVTHALALAESAAPTALEVCTSEGMRQVVSKPSGAAGGAAASANTMSVDSPDGQESTFSPNHCPFCLPIAERLGPPPLASLHFFHAEAGLARPDAPAFFLSLLARVARLPRGPPVRS